MLGVLARARSFGKRCARTKPSKSCANLNLSTIKNMWRVAFIFPLLSISISVCTTNAAAGLRAAALRITVSLHSLRRPATPDEAAHSTRTHQTVREV
jgi:hypothetical protein